MAGSSLLYLVLILCLISMFPSADAVTVLEYMVISLHKNKDRESVWLKMMAGDQVISDRTFDSTWRSCECPVEISHDLGFVHGTKLKVHANEFGGDYGQQHDMNCDGDTHEWRQTSQRPHFKLAYRCVLEQKKEVDMY